MKTKSTRPAAAVIRATTRAKPKAKAINKPNPAPGVSRTAGPAKPATSAKNRPAMTTNSKKNSVGRKATAKKAVTKKPVSKTVLAKKAVANTAAAKKIVAKNLLAKPTKAAKKSTRANAGSRRIRAAATPLPGSVAIPRRAIFIDVENTSSETELLRVIEHLEVDHTRQHIEITGIGNWKALGTRFARTLGKFGARLVHTAPPAGVRDWSDLWIAVNVGRWLAQARPGDLLDLISDDRAFDAIDDAAAASGVIFRRISYRSLAPRGRDPREKDVKEPEAEPAPPRRPRRSRRRRKPAAIESTTHAEAPELIPTARTTTNNGHPSEDGLHAASEEQVRVILERMTRDFGTWVNLDALANTLRTEGFTRPPGSPRLMTRLRRMKDVEVLPNGTLRLIPAEEV